MRSSRSDRRWASSPAVAACGRPFVVSDRWAAGLGSGGGGFNRDWDTNWTVATQVGDFGWSAEFEIPFSTLRYGSADTQQWGINFQRNIRRNNEVAYWAPLDRNRNLYRVSEAGTLQGVSPPPQRNLQITPYVLGRARRGRSAARRGRARRVHHGAGG